MRAICDIAPPWRNSKRQCTDRLLTTHRQVAVQLEESSGAEALSHAWCSPMNRPTATQAGGSYSGRLSSARFSSALRSRHDCRLSWPTCSALHATSAACLAGMSRLRSAAWGYCTAGQLLAGPFLNESSSSSMQTGSWGAVRNFGPSSACPLPSHSPHARPPRGKRCPVVALLLRRVRQALPHGRASYSCISSPRLLLSTLI